MKSLKIGESIAFNVSFQRIQIWGGGWYSLLQFNSPCMYFGGRKQAVIPIWKLVEYI
jgi:hypothetical protein